MKRNILLMVDSYKHSHYLQIPPEVKVMYSYIEARGCNDPTMRHTLFFGLQAFIKDVLCEPVTIEDVMEAKEIVESHGLPFNLEGWMYIVRKHGGKLPISIHAVPEGLVLPLGLPLVTLNNTDHKVPWLTSFVETILLRGVWYPTSVATISWHIRQIIAGFLEKTGDPSLIDFKLHDFGARGVSSGESAMLGGMGHLVSFKGTDTIEAIIGARRFYKESMAGFSIPASEHSTITSWKREREPDAYLNMVRKFAGEGHIYACVSDSYDIYNAVDVIWGKQLKEHIKAAGGTLVVRPDSGDPKTVVLKVMHSLWDNFGGTINAKGFKVLDPCVRVIQGDGVNPVSIFEILTSMMEDGFSADNIAFGMGGALLQKVDRDTFKWAMKASAAMDDDGWFDVYKDPVTDTVKKSKRGCVVTGMNVSDGTFKAMNLLNHAECDGYLNLNEIVYYNGDIARDATFEQIRRRAAKGLVAPTYEELFH